MFRRRPIVVAFALAVAACTNDFDRFDLNGGAGGGDSSTSGNGGSGGAGLTGGSGGASGGSAGSGGASGGDAAAGDGGGAGAADSGACGAGRKDCNGSCVLTSDPSVGCASPTDCSPCAFPNGDAKCSAGACALSVCAAGFGNCDGNEQNGCEQTIVAVLEHCGVCDRECVSTNVTSLECSAALCSSYCALGFGNCVRSTAGTDDGCETDIRANNANCGSCGNDCTRQGLVCSNMLCGCTGKSQCGGGGQADCNSTSRLCVCNGTTCRPGERCQQVGTSQACRCNGSTACGANEVCCQTPGGCRDLSTATDSCGACGRACPPSFVCNASVCECDADADCDAGSTGTCSAGLCACGTTTCAKGQRCLPNGSCG